MIGLLTAAALVASAGDDVDRAPLIDTDHAIAELATPAAPYKAARLYWTGESETAPANECHVAIQTEHGWTVAPAGTDCWGIGRYYRRIAVREFAVKAGLLWLRFEEESSDPDEGGTSHTDYLVICGLADGAARCTAPIETGYTFDTTPKWKVKASLVKGALVLALQTGKRSAVPAETAALLGRSTLSFK